MGMFKKKKKADLIPLDELVIALRILRKLEGDLKNTNTDYSMFICVLRYEPIWLVEEEIEKHGYTKIEDKFYPTNSLKSLKKADTKEGYHSSDLSNLPSLEL